MTEPRTPVLIGGGQFTYRGDAMDAPPPLELMKSAVAKAVADAGLVENALAETDILGVVAFTIDGAVPAARALMPHMASPPAALAQAVGATKARLVLTGMGGNTPQALVNWAAERIAEGEADLIVLAGAEFLGGLRKKLMSGKDVSNYGGGPDGEFEMLGDNKPGCSPQEEAHGLQFPTNVYPMFENALRAHLGRGQEEHSKALGKLFAPFSEVAAKNPNAWFPVARTAEEISTAGPKNRMVGYPYPKYMNAVIDVDQGAALIMASSAKADALGVPAEKRVYLHGCSDANDLWNPLDRVNYFSSPAIRTAAREAFAMAGKTPKDMSFFDIYSCFPVAVEVACAEMGIPTDDSRGLTVTGGLPYFGGPGNNYAMHAIAEMMQHLREKPGSYGLSTANGWFLTKHAMGVYSTTPTQGAWKRKPPASYQAEINALKGPEIVEAPNGAATIEAYTIVHSRDGYRMGIILGRDAQGRRFVANTPSDEDTLRDLESREGIGRAGTVSSADGKNLFVPS